MAHRTKYMTQWKIKSRRLLDEGQGKHGLHLIKMSGPVGQLGRRKERPGPMLPHVRPAATATALGHKRTCN